MHLVMNLMMVLDAQMRTINNNPNISCPNANWNGVTANYCDGTASDDVLLMNGDMLIQNIQVI